MTVQENPSYVPVAQVYDPDGGSSAFSYERLARVSLDGESVDALLMSLGGNLLLIGILETHILPDSAPYNVAQPLKVDSVPTGRIPLRPITMKSLEAICEELTGVQKFQVSPHPQLGCYSVETSVAKKALRYTKT